MTIHTLGLPRIGAQRQLKFALEAYWRGERSAEALEQTGRTLRLENWQWQQQAGCELLPVGDFDWYDPVATLALALGAVPERHQQGKPGLATLFALARGAHYSGQHSAALALCKFFDTNYHYLAPELSHDQRFAVDYDPYGDAVAEVRALGAEAKVQLIGPVTFLHLSRCAGDTFDRLTLLPNLLKAYGELLQRLAQQGVAWVQLEEPVLALELDSAWQQALETSCRALSQQPVPILLTSYFGSIAHHADLLPRLPVAGWHLDLCRAPEQLDVLLPLLGEQQVLSLGVIDGRGVWRADLRRWAEPLTPLREALGERLWLAPSCSLQYVPVDLNQEPALPESLKSRLAFARQKLEELAQLRRWLDGEGQPEASEARPEANPAVSERLAALNAEDFCRADPFEQRAAAQQAHLKLPRFPTTTIGSFPQTAAIRQLRLRHRRGELSQVDYHAALEREVTDCIRRQERLGLDVLVHGEAERTDMVEYFAEQLEGIATTRFGWVQSYGSRCVRPPIIHSDVARPGPMTVRWAQYAQGLTTKPVKGMLTGPVTLWKWAFVRDDAPRSMVLNQLALAVRDEVGDLEQAGIGIIQIDEPALREGLPLALSEQGRYLDEAVQAFRLASSGVARQTQIHTHMCYSEFGPILPAIAALDADVITIETARSGMALLADFDRFDYPNAIGPGVYDIHSPLTPASESMATLLRRALARLPAERLWVNPDCGLKTRQWSEVEPALAALVEAARSLRREVPVQSL
ncbi:5-methyltetrahydropteroyltriglutamate--homocysteine S-methyltransferase [Marinobacter hydrocarbonoclasticus]|nr:5-methyltetrahydropteroyltriglutamate--homocysteine S-methyltransferase [Marinobacter nauticus]